MFSKVGSKSITLLPDEAVQSKEGRGTWLGAERFGTSWKGGESSSKAYQCQRRHFLSTKGRMSDDFPWDWGCYLQGPNLLLPPLSSFVTSQYSPKITHSWSWLHTWMEWSELPSTRESNKLWNCFLPAHPHFPVQVPSSVFKGITLRFIIHLEVTKTLIFQFK